jgi:hypothetical protein
MVDSKSYTGDDGVNKKRDLIRLNTNITSELNDWLNAESERLGLTKSTVVIMALSHYKDQKSAIEKMPELLSGLDKLHDLLKPVANDRELRISEFDNLSNQNKGNVLEDLNSLLNENRGRNALDELNSLARQQR